MVSGIRSTELGIDFSAIAEAQQQDGEKDANQTAITGLQLKEIAIRYSQDIILCDTSTGQPCPVVPTSWRRKVFQAIHDLSHASIWAARKLVAARFVWKWLSKQVREWAKACISCQVSNTF